MNFKKIGFAISVVLLLFAFGYEFRQSITEPSFYVPTAFAFGSIGVVGFGISLLISKGGKETE